MQQKKLRLADLRIEQFARSGQGLAKMPFDGQDGKPVWAEVPFTAPGDEVKAALQKKRKGIWTSKLEQIVRPSVLRIEPRCIHFGVCGGCRWQHVPYDEQLRQKEAFVRSCFAKYLTPDVAFHPILPCDPSWNYRNKMELTFSSNKAKDHFLGLILFGSKGRVFNLTECHLPNLWMADAVQAVRFWWAESGLEAYHPPSDSGSLCNLILREGMATKDRMAVLTVSGNPDYALQKWHLESFAAFLRDAVEPIDPNQGLSIYLKIRQIAKGEPTRFYEMHLYGPDHIREKLSVQPDDRFPPDELSFNISPSAFFQPNTRQAENLYSRALKLAEIPKNGVVFDLYSGTGTLGLCAAKKAKQVMAVELSPESSLDARENAKANGIGNYTVYTGDVGKVLEKLKEESSLPAADLIMVDPPRAGLDGKALALLKEMNPPSILYISCNPATQSDNVEDLINSGYRLKALQPVDQFPHTVHIENIAVLKKVD